MRMNPSEVLAFLRFVIAAMLRIFIDPNSKLLMGGKDELVTDVVSRFQGYIKYYQEVADAEVLRETKLKARKPMERPVRLDIKTLHRALVALYGGENPMLKQFGFNPDKVVEFTGKENVDKAEKAKKTRQDNKTMGKRQKKAAKDSPPPNGGPQKG